MTHTKHATTRARIALSILAAALSLCALLAAGPLPPPPPPITPTPTRAQMTALPPTKTPTPFGKPTPERNGKYVYWLPWVSVP